MNLSKLDNYLNPKNSNRINRIFKDLDLKEVFKAINFTNSKIGEQHLYYTLRSPKKDISELAKLETKIADIQRLVNINFLKKTISRLNKDRCYNLADMAFSQWLNLPYWWYRKSPILVLLLLLSIIGFIIFPKVFIYPIILLPSIYLVLHIINKGFVFYAVTFFQNLYDFISVIEVLNDKNPIYKFKSQKHYKGYAPLIKILLVGEKIENKNIFLGTIGFFIDLLKGFFLIDVLIIRYLQKKMTFNEDFKIDFLNLGELDMILSIIELRKNKKVCTPIYKENALSGKSITHPIIKECVSNSIDTYGKSVLITGANMSGKTTFIKSIGVNLILARSIHTCFAKEFTFDFFDIFTSIDIEQNLADKKSYFKAEVDVMKELIHNSTIRKSLFIIDEIFKGTNTKERIALSFSILNYLAKNNNRVFVSTHDIELVHLLKGNFRQFHFDFKIENNNISYDYKMKEGAILHNYALQLIKQSDFPDEIVNNAEKILCE